MLHCVNNLSLTPRKEPGTTGEGIMTRGGKLTFSYFPLVCLRKDVSGREGKARRCLSSFITLITVAPRLSVLQPFHAALFSLHLSFALQSFYRRSQGPLTGPVCHADWGRVPVWSWGAVQRLNWGGGGWREQRRARVGRNELAAMQHRQASILAAAEREEDAMTPSRCFAFRLPPDLFNL